MEFAFSEQAPSSAEHTVSSFLQIHNGDNFIPLNDESDAHNNENFELINGVGYWRLTQSQDTEIALSSADLRYWLHVITMNDEAVGEVLLEPEQHTVSSFSQDYLGSTLLAALHRAQSRFLEELEDAFEIRVVIVYPLNLSFLWLYSPEMNYFSALFTRKDDVDERFMLEPEFIESISTANQSLFDSKLDDDTDLTGNNEARSHNLAPKKFIASIPKTRLFNYLALRGEEAYSFNSDSLPFSLNDQDEDNWCWASLTEGLLKLLRPDGVESQCQIATTILNLHAQNPHFQCCLDPASCDERKGLENVLLAYGLMQEFRIPNPIGLSDFYQWITEIRAPVALRVFRNGVSPHAVAVSAYRDNYLYVHDPAVGVPPQLHAHQALLDGVIGEWTDTYRCSVA